LETVIVALPARQVYGFSPQYTDSIW